MECRRDACECKLANKVAVLGQGWLTFIHLNEDTGLVSRAGGEGLCLVGRNGSIVLDKDGHGSASSFYTQGKWSDNKEQQILDIFRLVSR
jgi:hypothetical protein